MSEYKDLLERIGDQAPMPEPAFDRLVRHQERRRRNRRISAGVVGLIVTAVLVLALASSRPCRRSAAVDANARWLERADRVHACRQGDLLRHGRAATATRHRQPG